MSVICKSSNKSVCKMINNCEVFNPVCGSVVLNHSKRDNKRSFNVNNKRSFNVNNKRSFNIRSHKHGVIKSLNVRHILMTFIYFYELVLLFLIFITAFAMVMLIIC